MRPRELNLERHHEILPRRDDRKKRLLRRCGLVVVGGLDMSSFCNYVTASVHFLPCALGFPPVTPPSSFVLPLTRWGLFSLPIATAP
jgi:hypothetical protein